MICSQTIEQIKKKKKKRTNFDLWILYLQIINLYHTLLESKDHLSTRGKHSIKPHLQEKWVHPSIKNHKMGILVSQGKDSCVG